MIFSIIFCNNFDRNEQVAMANETSLNATMDCTGMDKCLPNYLLGPVVFSPINVNVNGLFFDFFSFLHEIQLRATSTNWHYDLGGDLVSFQ